MTKQQKQREDRLDRIAFRMPEIVSAIALSALYLFDAYEFVAGAL